MLQFWRKLVLWSTFGVEHDGNIKNFWSQENAFSLYRLNNGEIWVATCCAPVNAIRSVWGSINLSPGGLSLVIRRSLALLQILRSWGGGHMPPFSTIDGSEVRLRRVKFGVTLHKNIICICGVKHQVTEILKIRSYKAMINSTNYYNICYKHLNELPV